MHSVNSPLKLELSTISNARWTVCGGPFTFSLCQPTTPPAREFERIVFDILRSKFHYLPQRKRFLHYKMGHQYEKHSFSILFVSFEKTTCTSRTLPNNDEQWISEFEYFGQSRHYNDKICMGFVCILSFNSKRIFFHRTLIKYGLIECPNSGYYQSQSKNA